MNRKLKIGIAGCGAIGKTLAKMIIKDNSLGARSVYLFDIDDSKSSSLSEGIYGDNRASARNIEELINKCNLIVECASSKSAYSIAKKSLSCGRNTLTMSVAGIIGHYSELAALAGKNNCRLFIPSGAIAGLDAVKAYKTIGIKKVTLVTTKNPRSFKGVKYVENKQFSLDNIKKDKVLFYGSAYEAVKYFPQNVNVAAVLSLAGIGSKKTLVKIIASPYISENMHEIKLESTAGRVNIRVENVVHPNNPKTSYLAVLSAYATLKQIMDPVRVGT
ncbi:MAG: DUF108 domain-containing protein [Candidatus Omnitrophota bacterium]|jgi:aspartate dehydrogenase|nr:MAG: DUF108 domain-containing protein [Candidatus Omnitrophota bacterium]